MPKIPSWLIILATGTVFLSVSKSVNLLKSQTSDFQAQNTPSSIDIPELPPLKKESIAQKYNVAVLGDSSKVFEQETVIATGFPFGVDISKDHGFKLTEEKITVLLDKSIENGYQIGFTNSIQKGMSGRPVLNLQGEVIAINGLHAYPLWGESYKYDNSEQISLEIQEKMAGSSWGIPINNFLQLANPFLSSNCQDIKACNRLDYSN